MNRLGLPEVFIILDTEVTTWEGAAIRNWSGPSEHRELVQLGAAVVGFEPATGKVQEITTLCTLVKPVINPALSDYFIELTGITQEMIDEKAIPFKEFLPWFTEWAGWYDLYSCDTKIDGSHLFDRDVLMENCKLNKLEFPFEQDRFFNIHETFHRDGYIIKQSGQASLAFGVEPKQRSHDALKDVRGLIDGLNLLIERGPKK